jgi:hypothetical protein
MTSESGDQKLLGNFRKLIDFVSADPNYNPANTKIGKPALETLYSSGQASTVDLKTNEAPYKITVNSRQTLFADVAPRMGSAFRMAKASGADQPVLDDLSTYRRKLSSQPKAKAPKADPSKPGSEGGTSNTAHSTSQMSYENQAGNVDSMVALIANIPSYNPNESELTLTSLRAFAAELRAANDAVSASFVPLSQARGIRDEVLYTGEDSVVNIALLVKAYVSAAFGIKSQLYKQIKGLQFHRQGKTG